MRENQKGLWVDRLLVLLRAHSLHSITTLKLAIVVSNKCVHARLSVLVLINTFHLRTQKSAYACSYKHSIHTQLSQCLNRCGDIIIIHTYIYILCTRTLSHMTAYEHIAAVFCFVIFSLFILINCLFPSLGSEGFSIRPRRTSHTHCWASCRIV